MASPSDIFENSSSNSSIKNKRNCFETTEQRFNYALIFGVSISVVGAVAMFLVIWAFVLTSSSASFEEDRQKTFGVLKNNNGTFLEDNAARVEKEFLIALPRVRQNETSTEEQNVTLAENETLSHHRSVPVSNDRVLFTFPSKGSRRRIIPIEESKTTLINSSPEEQHHTVDENDTLTTALLAGQFDNVSLAENETAEKAILVSTLPLVFTLVGEELGNISLIENETLIITSLSSGKNEELVTPLTLANDAVPWQSLQGKWRLDRSENLEEYLDEVGMPWLIAKIAARVTYNFYIRVNQTSVKMQIESPLKLEPENDHKVNGPPTIVTWQGRKYLALTTWQHGNSNGDGGKLVDKKISAFGDPNVKPEEVTRQIIKSQLLTTMRIGEVTAKQYFDRVE